MKFNRNHSVGGRRHWTTTYGCNVFPGFVHIHMGLTLTQSTDGERKQCGITLWNGLPWIFKDANSEPEIFSQARFLWEPMAFEKNQWASRSPEMETNVPSRGWKQFLAGKIENKLSEINSLGTIQFCQHHTFTVVHYTIFMLIHVYIYHIFWICAYTVKI